MFGFDNKCLYLTTTHKQHTLQYRNLLFSSLLQHLLHIHFICIASLRSEFDQLALDVLDECYEKDAAIVQSMIRRPLDDEFQRQSCLELAHVAQSRQFLSHKCCMSVIDDVWNGIVSPEVSNVKVCSS